MNDYATALGLGMWGLSFLLPRLILSVVFHITVTLTASGEQQGCLLFGSQPWAEKNCLRPKGQARPLLTTSGILSPGKESLLELSKANRWGEWKQWQILFGGVRVTADGDCSREIKRCLLLGRKSMTNIDSILKSRDITLLRKVRLVKAMVFPIVMYGCESWTIQKAECWRIDAFELWFWRRLLGVPWTARRANQSILQEISPE